MDVSDDQSLEAGVEHHFAPEALNGPYKRIVKGVLNASSGKMKMSSPRVIADTVKKIVNAKDPKTRYLVGKMAKPLVRIRALFGDKAYDKVIMSQVK